MSGTVLVILGIFALLLAALAAIAAESLREFSRAQLKDLLRQRNLPSRYGEIVAQHKAAALAAESLRVMGTAAAVLAAAAFIWRWRPNELPAAQALAVTAAEVVGGAILLWLTLVWLPGAVGRVWAERFLASTWPLWKATSAILSPSVAGARFVERLLDRMAGTQAKPLTEERLEEEIREVVTEGQREGLLEEDAREMIESVIALHEVQISEIMTPRTDMVSMPAELPWDEALKLVIASGHTRIPVYGKSRDEVIGILHIKDMLSEMARGPGASKRPIAELLRPPFFVPKTKPVDRLLEEFQRGRNHLAVVMDEYGGVSGLVTIEDVLEEIVGEIADEHDDATSDGIKILSETSCEALARVHISEINARLHLALPEDEHFDTIGGFVFHELGRVPQAGDEVLYDRVKIRVLEATRRRINRVAIEVLPPAEANESADAQVEARESA